MFNLKKEILSLLENLISIPSINPGDEKLIASSKYGEKYYLDWITNYLNNMGLYFFREKVLDNRDNLYISTKNLNFDDIKILFQTHSDTVSEGNMKNPFSMNIIDNKIYGRGSCDAKGQFCSMIMGLIMALQESREKADKICIALCCDEEHKHIGVDNLIKKNLPNLNFVIVGEPTDLKMAAACKGSIRFKIITSGISVHTAYPQNGYNAIYLMAKIINIIENKLIPITISKISDLCGNATIVVSLINGGTIVNAVPDKCIIHIDRRIIPGEDWKEVYNEIKLNIFSELTTLEQKYVHFEYPYLIDPSYSNITEHNNIKNILKKHNLYSNFIGLEYGCDASKLSIWNKPTYVFGPGSIKEAHTDNEFIKLDELIIASHFYKDLILST